MRLFTLAVELRLGRCTATIGRHPIRLVLGAGRVHAHVRRLLGLQVGAIVALGHHILLEVAHTRLEGVMQADI